MKTTLSALIMMLILSVAAGPGHCAGPAFSMGRAYNHYPNDIANVTGTVVSTSLNAIDIRDEEDKRVKRYIYLGTEQFRKDEYIRIYYHPENALVVTIKRMTVLPYKGQGQNLGYMSR